METQSIYEGMAWQPGNEICLGKVNLDDLELRLVRRLWGMYVECWQGNTRVFCTSAMLILRGFSAQAENVKTALPYLKCVLERFEKDGLPPREIMSAGA